MHSHAMGKIKVTVIKLLRGYHRHSLSQELFEERINQ